MLIVYCINFHLQLHGDMAESQSIAVISDDELSHGEELDDMEERQAFQSDEEVNLQLNSQITVKNEFQSEHQIGDHYLVFILKSKF